MTKIAININKCNECPHFNRTRYYTSDSWEVAYDWWCTKMSDDTEKCGHKKISGYVEWNDVKNIEIPDWCPAKIED